MATAPSRSSDDAGREAAPGAEEGEESRLDSFEKLDKWKRCDRQVDGFLVYQEHLQRAEFNGFPSSLEVGLQTGLNSHEVAALMGWTTGDFRFINPIARGLEEVTFEDYPLGVKATCRLTRQEVLPYVQLISSALRMLHPAPSKRRLWRGHRMPFHGVAGSVTLFSGFTSATYDRDDALRFAAQGVASEGCSRRTVFAIDDHFSGRNIASFSARRSELEVLFPLGCHFEVLPTEEGECADTDEQALRAAESELRRASPMAELRLVRLREVLPDAELAAGPYISQDGEASTSALQP